MVGPIVVGPFDSNDLGLKIFLPHSNEDDLENPMDNSMASRKYVDAAVKRMAFRWDCLVAASS